MRLGVKKENGSFITRIWLKNQVVFEQFGYETRAEATLNAWVNALFIRDIASATEASVEQLMKGY